MGDLLLLLFLSLSIVRQKIECNSLVNNLKTILVEFRNSAKIISTFQDTICSERKRKAEN